MKNLFYLVIAILSLIPYALFAGKRQTLAAEEAVAKILNARSYNIDTIRVRSYLGFTIGASRVNQIYMIVFTVNDVTSAPVLMRASSEFEMNVLRHGSNSDFLDLAHFLMRQVAALEYSSTYIAPEPMVQESIAISSPQFSVPSNYPRTRTVGSHPNRWIYSLRQPTIFPFKTAVMCDDLNPRLLSFKLSALPIVVRFSIEEPVYATGPSGVAVCILGRLLQGKPRSYSNLQI